MHPPLFNNCRRAELSRLHVALNLAANGECLIISRQRQPRPLFTINKTRVFPNATVGLGTLSPQVQWEVPENCIMAFTDDCKCR
jgi:hypothetical protein